MFFAACLISWLFGIFLSGYLDSNILVFILPAFCTLLWMGMRHLIYRIRNKQPPRSKKPIKILILLGIMTASSLLYQGYEKLRVEKAVSLCKENPVSVTGVVTGEVSRYNDTDYCTITLDNGEKLSVKIRTDKSLFPGERVTLQEPTLSVVQPGNRKSGQVQRLLGNGTFLSATFPYEPTVIRHGVGNWWLYSSKTLRNLARDHFTEHYPPAIASFLTALISSDKSMIPEELYQEFINTGTVHIVVVSGMHFSFLAGALLFALGPVCQSRRKRLFIVLPLLVVFAWFTGGTIPVMRSLLMISLLFCYDIFYWKPIKSYETVLAIACLFVAGTPTLIFNPSFLLTFGATFGITAFYQPLLKAFQKVPTGYLRNTLAMYVAVQPFTLPVLLLYFSRLPVGAILANFLVAPLVAPILILAVLGIVFAKVPLLGTLILWIGNILTGLFLFFIHISAAISRPLTVPLKATPFLLWLSGAVLLFFGYRIRTKPKRIGTEILATVVLITAYCNTVFPIPDNQLTVTFMGAKNTNSAVITTPADRLILYGTLQDIAYGRGSAYDEYAPVELIILTELPDSENTQALLQELPSAQMICPARYAHLLENSKNTVLLNSNLATQTDGLYIRLFADETTLYEAEFSYREYQFSFSQNADYLLKNAQNNPDKIWIVNFKRSGKTTDQIAGISEDFRMLSKKEWHPDTKLYDNYSMLIFDREGLTFYGTKEQQLLWNSKN